MRNAQVVSLIREIATELQPFTRSRRPGDSIWDGRTYTERVGEEFHLDPHALMWWSTLSSIAEMVERQQSPLTKEQLEYLKKMLFGGMGSFQDWSLDPNTAGSNASATNGRIRIILSTLFELF